MAVPALHVDLHQVGIERGQRAFKRPAKRCDGFLRGRGNARALGRIAEPRSDTHRELAGVGNLLGAVGSIDCLGDPTTWNTGNWQLINSDFKRTAEGPFWNMESFADHQMKHRDEVWMGVTYQF